MVSSASSVSDDVWRPARACMKSARTISVMMSTPRQRASTVVSIPQLGSRTMLVSLVNRSYPIGEVSTNEREPLILNGAEPLRNNEYTVVSEVTGYIDHLILERSILETRAMLFRANIPAERRVSDRTIEMSDIDGQIHHIGLDPTRFWHDLLTDFDVVPVDLDAGKVEPLPVLTERIQVTHHRKRKPADASAQIDERSARSMDRQSTRDTGRGKERACLTVDMGCAFVPVVRERNAFRPKIERLFPTAGEPAHAT